MLGHADIKQTQRYLNITDEELRKAMTGVWEKSVPPHLLGVRAAFRSAIHPSRNARRFGRHSRS
jgi:hypothetical protein